jgi:uncharacterized protein YndB with AHSA1/START domain
VPADLLELRVTIAAPVDRVWTALTDTGAMAEWMGEPGMALVVDTDWAPGSGIVVRGEHNGPFENDGIVLRHQPPERLAYTHRSSVSGLPDDPSSYTTLEFVLAPAGNGTALTLRARFSHRIDLQAPALVLVGNTTGIEGVFGGRPVL